MDGEEEEVASQKAETSKEKASTFLVLDMLKTMLKNAWYSVGVRAHSISDGSGIRNLGLGFLEVLWRNGFLRQAELGFSSFLANVWPCLVIFQSGARRKCCH